MLSMLRAKSSVEKNQSYIGKLYFPRLITRILQHKGIQPPRSYISIAFGPIVLDLHKWHLSVNRMRGILSSEKGKAMVSCFGEGTSSVATLVSQSN